jgi:hypothetical protein
MLIHKVIQCEHLADEEENHEEKKNMRVCLNALVSILIGVFCAYLSYSSNIGVAMPLRIIYAIVAAFFGIFYLFYYFFGIYLSKVFKK